MWSIASHAGAGVAIAGLSATYYALSRRNYQLERDTGMRGGRSDADKGNTRPSREDMISISKSQSLLLKNELSHLGHGSGHANGLNVINKDYDYCEPITTHFGMSVKQIVSRGHINFPKNAISIEDLSKVHLSDATYQKTVPVSDEPNLYTSNQRNPNNAPSPSSFDEDESEQLCTAERDPNEVTQENQGTKSTGVEMVESLPHTKPRTPKMSQSLLSRDSINARRTRSPIIYYKNPGFGKRFACKMQESTQFLSLHLPGSGLAKDIKEDERYWSPEQNYKDSTQFLFPPVLSESKLSVCEDEEGEFLLEDRQTSFDKPIDDMDATELATDGLSRMDEIRDYNLQLQLLQDARDAVETGFVRENQTPEILIKSEDYCTSNDALIQTDFTTPTEPEEEFFEVEELEIERKSDPIVETVLLTPIRSVEMEGIPATSWISLPARLYADSQQIPANVRIFLAVVILLLGFMSTLFVSISGWISAPINDDDDEYNPSAMLDH